MNTGIRFRLAAAAAAIAAMYCTSPPEQLARAVADSWLEGVDVGEFDAVWELTADSIRSQLG